MPDDLSARIAALLPSREHIAKRLAEHPFGGEQNYLELAEELWTLLDSHGPDDLDQFIRDQAAASPDFAVAMIEAEHAAKVREFEGLLASIWLYVSWHHVTRQLTTEQKELWADAIDANRAQMNADEPHINLSPVDRWWRQ